MGGFKDLPTLQSGETSGHIVAIATIVGLIFVQQVLQALENTARAHEHAKVMLQHGYRELATMGLVAFVLFIIEQGDGLQSASKQTLAVFEGVHIMLFVLAIIYLLLVIAVVQLSVLQSDDWARMERTFAFDLNAYHDLRARFQALRRLLAVHSRRKTTQVCTRAWLTLLHPWETAAYWRTRATMRFLEHRFKSVRNGHMKSDQSFAALLKSRSSSVFSDLIRLPLGAWVAFVYIIAWDLLLRAVWQAYADAVSTHVVIICGCACVCAAALVVYFKVRDIHWRVLLTPTRRVQPHVMPTPKPTSVRDEDQPDVRVGGVPVASTVTPSPMDAETAPMHDSPASPAESSERGGEGDATATADVSAEEAAADAQHSNGRAATQNGEAVASEAVHVRFADEAGASPGGIIRARRAASSGSFIFAHTGVLADASSTPAAPVPQQQTQDDTRSLFWFRAPLLLIRLMQCIMCVGALTLAHALVYTYSQPYAGAYIAVSALSLVLACICMRMCVPLVIIVMHAEVQLSTQHDVVQDNSDANSGMAQLLAAAKEHSHVLACLHTCFCVAALSFLRVLPLFIVCAVTAASCVCDALVRVRYNPRRFGSWMYVLGCVTALACAVAASIVVYTTNADITGDTLTRVLTCVSAAAPACTQIWGYYRPTADEGRRGRCRIFTTLCAHVAHVGLGVRVETPSVSTATSGPSTPEKAAVDDSAVPVELRGVSAAVANAIGRDVCAVEDMTVSIPTDADGRIHARRMHTPSLQGLFAPLQNRSRGVTVADGAAAAAGVDAESAPPALRLRAPDARQDSVDEDGAQA